VGGDGVYGDNGPPRGRLEPDLVPLLGFGAHASVPRRRARSCQTVARSAPGSPRPSGQALGDAGDRAGVGQDLQGHLRTFQVVYGNQNGLGPSLRVRMIHSCCWRICLASSDSRALASDSGTGVAVVVIVRSIGNVDRFRPGHYVGSIAARDQSACMRRAYSLPPASWCYSLAELTRFREPNGEPTEADAGRRTATSGDNQFSELPLQATPGDVPRRKNCALQARGHWFEPSCAHPGQGACCPGPTRAMSD
jgi:hypothetical protein